MRLRDLPKDTFFVPVHPAEIQPLYHKGDDGRPRLVRGGWSGHCTSELSGSEAGQITDDTEVQGVCIPPQHSYGE